MRRAIVIAVMAGLGVTSCASTPRAFEPRMAGPPSDRAAWESAFAQCSEDVSAGRRDSFRSGRTGSAVGGTAIAGTAGVVTAGSAMSGAGMLSGAAAGAGLAIGFVLVAPLAIYGVSRVQRANKEREIKDAMTLCLAEEGFVVTDWTPAGRDGVGPRSPTTASSQRGA